MSKEDVCQYKVTLKSNSQLKVFFLCILFSSFSLFFYYFFFSKIVFFISAIILKGWWRSFLLMRGSVVVITLYKMIRWLRTHCARVYNNISKSNFKYEAAVDLNKCMKQIKLPHFLCTSAPISELPSNNNKTDWYTAW